MKLLEVSKSTLLNSLKISPSLQTLCNNLEDTWLSKKYIEALITIALRKQYMSWLRVLCWQYLSYNKKIKATVENFNTMMANPYTFYLEYKGQKNFRKYGSISLAYTNFSLINLVNRILKDAKEVSGYYTKEFEDDITEIYWEFKENRNDFIGYIMWNDYWSRWFDEINPFSNVSAERLQEALQQDILWIWLPKNILDEFKQILNFDQLNNTRSFGSGNSKIDFFDWFFCYFSSIEDIRDFTQKWEKNENNFKEETKKDFLIKFYNEPNINPRLITMTPRDLWTKKFEKERKKWREEVQYWGKRKNIIIDWENSDQFY